MAVKPERMVWVTANRTIVGGPRIGFTLEKDECYEIPNGLAKEFVRDGAVELGKVRRERKPRVYTGRAIEPQLAQLRKWEKEQEAEDSQRKKEKQARVVTK